jgi:nitrate reductase gamma subunit
MSDRALFAIAPYVAALIFILGTLTRLALARVAQHRPSGVPDTGLHARVRGHRVFVVALLLVLITHLAMWISPRFVLAWNGSVTHVMAIEIPLFVNGLIAGLGLASVLIATRTSPGVADTILRGMLAVAIVSGLAMAVRYRWASTWSAVTLTPYVRSLVAFHPDTRLLEMPYLIRLHVFSGIALIGVLPFTGVMTRLLRRK